MSIGKIELRENKKEYVKYANMSSSGPGDISNTPITFEQATELANVQSGDPVSVALGKLSKLYATLESGSAGTLLGENLDANKIMVTDANGKIAASDISKDLLSNLKSMRFDSDVTRAMLMENAEIGITHVTTNANSPTNELPGGTMEWKRASGLLLKRTTQFGTIVLFGYGTGNTAVTTTDNGGGTWSPYYNPQDKLDSLPKNYVMLESEESIPANADLDSYKTLGNYCCDTSAVAATLQNCPADIAFKMIVDYATGYGYTRQILIPYKSNAIYMRSADDNGNYPSKWERFVTYSDMIHSFIVEDFTGAYSIESLRTQLHNRMIALYSNVRDYMYEGRHSQIPWSGEWVGLTRLSGTVTFMLVDGTVTYIVTAITYVNYFFGYGNLSSIEIKYFHSLTKKS